MIMAAMDHVMKRQCYVLLKLYWREAEGWISLATADPQDPRLGNRLEEIDSGF